MSQWLGDTRVVRNVEVREVRFKDNPHYPLPPDYDDYDEDGRRLLRLNACRQWLLHPRYADPQYHQRDPGLRTTGMPLRLVYSLRFFDQYYLQEAFTQGLSNFYEVEPEPEAPHLDEITRVLHNNHLSIVVVPRGFAKSTLFRKIVLLCMVSSVRFIVHYWTTTMPNAKRQMAPVFREIESNARLIDDWAPQPEFGGILRGGTRGKTQPWAPNNGEGTLSNDSSMFFGGIDEAGRGARPHLLCLDDVERDAKESTDMQSLRKLMWNAIFKIYKPMIRDPRRQLLWLGTIVSQQHLLAHATLEDPETRKLPDESFRQFARVILQAGYPHIDDVQESLWETYWPAKQMREDFSNMTPEERVVAKGEYFAMPGSSVKDGFLLDGKLHGYRIRGPNREPLPGWGLEPDLLGGTVSWWSQKHGEERSMSVREFLSTLRIFITSDWNLSISMTSDFSAIAVMGQNTDNELFVLDMFLARMMPSDLVVKIVEYIFRWKPRAVGVEAPSLDHSIYQSLHMALERDMANLPRRPKMIRIPTQGESKEEKIAGLQWRLGTKENPVGYLKLPFQWRNLRWWSDLFFQIENHDPGVKGGGLAHDDAIDVIAMESRMLQSIPAHTPDDTFDERAVLQRLLKGERYDQHGNPLSVLVDWDTLPAELIDRIVDVQQSKLEESDARSKREPVIAGLPKGGRRKPVSLG